MSLPLEIPKTGISNPERYNERSCIAVYKPHEVYMKKIDKGARLIYGFHFLGFGKDFLTFLGLKIIYFIFLVKQL